MRLTDLSKGPYGKSVNYIILFIGGETKVDLIHEKKKKKEMKVIA